MFDRIEKTIKKETGIINTVEILFNLKQFMLKWGTTLLIIIVGIIIAIIFFKKIKKK
jgi:hypothetical protein